MPYIISISDASDEQLDGYRNLPERTLRGESIFLAEGDLLVTRLLQSRFRTRSILAVERFLSLIEVPIPDDVPVYVVSEETMRAVTGFGFYQGIMALGEREPIPKTATIIDNPCFVNGSRERNEVKRPDRTRDDPVTALCSVPGCHVHCDLDGAWVILPNALKPDNLGLIFRSCAALGARGVILGEQCCDPFSRRALRVSMGGVLQVPIYKSDTLADDLVRLRDEAGFELCATVLDDDAVSLYDCGNQGSGIATSNWAKRVGFVFGHEFSGLTDPWLSCCTKKIMIPIAPGVDSLNLGVSVGVFLYEYNRRGI